METYLLRKCVSGCDFGLDNANWVSGLDVRRFEEELKTDNKSGNSILNVFSGSGLDVVEGGEFMNLDKYFQIDDDAFYEDKNGKKKFRGVQKYYWDTVRNDKAIQQSKIPPISIGKILAYINEFIELLREENGYGDKNVRLDTIVLDNSIHLIIDNGIICNQLNWKSPIYDKEIRRYVEWDYKYDIIKNKFNLRETSDIVWIKFTTNGHVGVVAKSFDINFDSKTDDGKSISSDVLVKEVGETWDKSFVMIFPMTSDILGNHSVGELELGIGNYLIEKNVPIIDFYSHYN